jgi:hypothetical protein
MPKQNRSNGAAQQYRQGNSGSVLSRAGRSAANDVAERQTPTTHTRALADLRSARSSTLLLCHIVSVEPGSRFAEKSSDETIRENPIET